jgi:hypothetical protein
LCSLPPSSSFKVKKIYEGLGSYQGEEREIIKSLRILSE